VKERKRPKLPRGLRWHSESQYIWFVWYDAKGKQHKKSTETTDLSNQSLERVTQLYFDWRLANNSPETVSAR